MANLNLKFTKFIILGVANVWSPRKGLKYFIEMADMLLDDEVIVLVGVSEKQMNLLPDNIVGVTRTHDLEELVDIYSSSDVFVNPTIEDNFPTTNLEALACGTPVITFDTGGSPESIDSNTGIIVSRKNTECLYEATKKYRFSSKSSGTAYTNRAKALYKFICQIKRDNCLKRSKRPPQKRKSAFS